jgi:para-nitrobenzyl esterase
VTLSRDLTDAVYTDTGDVRGLVKDGVCTFLGIPFAAAPSGTRRFQEARKPAGWCGTRRTLVHGAAAVQERVSAELAIPTAAMDVRAPLAEDCLYLNVWTRRVDDGARPVLVWLHGGSFLEGAASQAWYDGAALARSGDIVVVTVNYRLGALGWLYLPEREGIETTANAGLLDQVAALEWVRDSIAAFGGDPGNVTLAGQSAGARSVAALLASPRATGLFHKAVILSGAAHCLERDEAELLSERVLWHAGVRANEPGGLLTLPALALAESSTRCFAEGLTEALPPRTPRRFAPVRDGTTVTEQPLEAVAAGRTRHLPLLVGTVADEMRLALPFDARRETLDEAALVERLRGQVGEISASLVRAFRRAREQRAASAGLIDVYYAILGDWLYGRSSDELVEAHAAAGGSGYRSIFARPSPVAGLGACHTIDLAFLFGSFEIPGMRAFSGSGVAVERLSGLLQRSLVAFMRTGSPALEQLPEWPAYEGARRCTMLWHDEPRVEDDPFASERAAWRSAG